MRALVARLWRDRLVAIATLLAAGAVLWPLACTTIVPLMDLPHHVALAAILGDILLGRAPATTFYELNVATPYWTLYVLLAIFTRLFGVFAGTKIVVGLALLVVPLGAMRLLVALGRSPIPGIAVFLLSWDFSVYFGWINFVLGIGFSLFALARLVEVKTARDALRCWPSVVLVAVTHGLALALLGTMGALTALLGRRQLRGIGLSALALAPGLIVLPWLLAAASQSSAAAVPTRAIFDSTAVKIHGLFANTVGAGLVGAEIGAAQGAAFVALLVLPALLGWIRQDRSARVGGGVAVAPVVAAVAAYAFLPLAISGQVEHWGDYPRFASMIFVGLLFLPRPSFRGSARLVLVPILIVLGWLSLETGRAFAKIDAQLAPLRSIVELVPVGASVLPLALDTKFPPADRPIGEALALYVTGANRGFNPYLFSYPTNLVHYRAGARLPAPPGWGRVAQKSDVEAYASHYDFILVEGLAADPVRPGALANGKRIVRVGQKRRFRLYKVE